jgi:hypothetical protein
MQILSDKNDAGRLSLEAEDLQRGLHFALRLAWDVLRVPALTVLVILQPVVEFVLCTSALLVLLSAILLKLTTHRPEVPFWGMVAVSVGCVWALALYHGVMRILSVRPGVRASR